MRPPNVGVGDFGAPGSRDFSPDEIRFTRTVPVACPVGQSALALGPPLWDHAGQRQSTRPAYRGHFV